MRSFHAIVHHVAASFPVERSINVQGVSAQVLAVQPEQLQEPWPIDFQTVFDRLEPLPRMYIELDGSWVWVGQTGDGQAWQMDGLLNDSPRGLMTLEIKGQMPRWAWDEFRGHLVDPAAPLVFQLMQEGVYLSEAEFAAIFLEG